MYWIATQNYTGMDVDATHAGPIAGLTCIHIEEYEPLLVASHQVIGYN